MNLFWQNIMDTSPHEITQQKHIYFLISYLIRCPAMKGLDLFVATHAHEYSLFKL